MRRITLIATAIGMLILAGVAYAATSQINTYTAKLTFKPKVAGTAKKPAAVGYTETLTAAGTNGNRTAILQDIKTKIYGLAVDQKDFPSCSLDKIAATKGAGCPKGSLAATGYIHAEVGSPTDFKAGAAECDPGLNVWNSGPGKLTFYFVTTPAHNCNALGITTGGTPPYPGTVKKSGKFLVVNVPIPAAINRPLGLAGSLKFEHLVFTHQSKKVKGKTVQSLASVACQHGKRPYSVSFTANLPTTNQTQTVTKSGTGAC